MKFKVTEVESDSVMVLEGETKVRDALLAMGIGLSRNKLKFSGKSWPDLNDTGANWKILARFADGEPVVVPEIGGEEMMIHPDDPKRKKVVKSGRWLHANDTVKTLMERWLEEEMNKRKIDPTKPADIGLYGAFTTIGAPKSDVAVFAPVAHLSPEERKAEDYRSVLQTEEFNRQLKENEPPLTEESPVGQLPSYIRDGLFTPYLSYDDARAAGDTDAYENTFDEVAEDYYGIKDDDMELKVDPKDMDVRDREVHGRAKGNKKITRALNWKYYGIGKMEEQICAMIKVHHWLKHEVDHRLAPLYAAEDRQFQQTTEKQKHKRDASPPPKHNPASHPFVYDPDTTGEKRYREKESVKLAIETKDAPIDVLRFLSDTNLRSRRRILEKEQKALTEESESLRSQIADTKEETELRILDLSLSIIGARNRLYIKPALDNVNAAFAAKKSTKPSTTKGKFSSDSKTNKRVARASRRLEL